jgi:hypothetical protein
LLVLGQLSVVFPVKAFMTRLVKTFILFFSFLSVTLASYGQTVADPAYANMQRAVGGIIQQTAQSRGYSTTDPRTYSTLYGVGQTATSAAVGVGAGLLIAGTSPAWGSVLAYAAITAGVSYAVNIGIDALIKWAFPSSTSGQLTVTAPVFTGSTTYPNQVLYSGDAATYQPTSGTLFMASATGYSYTCVGNDSMAILNCSIANGPGSGSAANNMNPPYCNCGSTGCMFGKARLNSYGNQSQAVLLPPLTFGSSYRDVGYSCTPSKISSNTIFNDGSSVPEYVKNCPIGTAASYTTNNGALSWTQCIVYSTTNASSSSGTSTDAASSLTSSQKSTPVDYSTMALMINQLWKQAATTTGYAGIPYSATQPITSADVQAWAQANPAAYPTVEALTTPVANASTDLKPSTSIQPSTAVSPAISPTATTATNPSTQPVINLGSDPNIGPPSLETPPTAPQILAPILGLFPSLKNFAVPAHSGECPKPSFDAFDKHFVMESHCSMFEQNRSALSGFMLLAFSLVAIFIVLSA